MARNSTVPNCAQVQGHSAPCVLFEWCLSQLRDLAILITDARESREHALDRLPGTPSPLV